MGRGVNSLFICLYSERKIWARLLRSTEPVGTSRIVTHGLEQLYIMCIYMSTHENSMKLFLIAGDRYSICIVTSSQIPPEGKAGINGSGGTASRKGPKSAD